MMENGLVSVIITTYGRAEELIFEAINSVRNQTYHSIEIIVVDDNGKGTDTQKSNEILFSKEKDIKYIANEKIVVHKYLEMPEYLYPKGNMLRA